MQCHNWNNSKIFHSAYYYFARLCKFNSRSRDKEPARLTSGFVDSANTERRLCATSGVCHVDIVENRGNTVGYLEAFNGYDIDERCQSLISRVFVFPFNQARGQVRSTYIRVRIGELIVKSSFAEENSRIRGFVDSWIREFVEFLAEFRASGFED